MSASDDDDNDKPCLSAETLAALQEYFTEKNEREEAYRQLERDHDMKENITFDENWQLSQFWYDDKTIDAIVKVVKNTLLPNGSICLISCPTLYMPLRKSLDKECTVKLLEFDRRFEVYEDNFIYYDYNNPLSVPSELTNSFDIVIADPPFLSEECLHKTAETVKHLSRDKIIVCTGAVMTDLITEILKVHICNFKPEHKNNLANEFSCFANFDIDKILG